jgi:CubicO group peptidase (beta-lactamase class C family)
METVAAIPIQLLIATAAKVLASAVFVTGRDVQAALRDSAFHAIDLNKIPVVQQLGAIFRELATVDVDDLTQTVTVSLTLDSDSVPRVITAYQAAYPDFRADWTAEAHRLLSLGRVGRQARYFGDQGCAILREEDDTISFERTTVHSVLPPAATQSWPNGDRLNGPPRSDLDRASIARAIDLAFEDRSAHTAAVMVLHRGDIVGERYRDDLSMQSRLEGWSMGKSVTATLAGVLVQQGLLSIEEPAPIPLWRRDGDPRSGITVRHLMQMRSGLQFSGTDESRTKWRLGVSDHLYPYSEAIDVFDFVTTRPVEYPAGSVGRYRNCDPLSLGCVIKHVVTDRLGENILQWPQKALFDRIGVRGFVFETDLYGNFISSGFDYAPARDWARLGQLYLQQGVWDGVQILPSWWAQFVSSPAPGWESGCYGGQFWLNRAAEYELPDDAYYMAGIGEQRVFIVPSAELVIVRLGHRAGDNTAKAAINAMLSRLKACITST